MLILTKKKFMFRNADGDAFTTKGGMLIEEAPKWIAKQLLYMLAKDDGDIVEVKGNSEAAEAVAVAKATETKAKAAKKETK